jgi:hypothetical protein
VPDDDSSLQAALPENDPALSGDLTTYLSTPEMQESFFSKVSSLVDKGKITREVMLSIDFFLKAGVQNPITENGRHVNNRPDMRVQAVDLLGKIGGPEAKGLLLRVMQYDPDMDVQIEAIQTLAGMGLDDANTARIFAGTTARVMSVGPGNSRFAAKVLDALQKYGESVSGKVDSSVMQVISTIGEGPYSRATRDKAKSMLINFILESHDGDK